MKDWLARWCGCHVVPFLSYLQKTNASYYMCARRRTIKERWPWWFRHPSIELPVEWLQRVACEVSAERNKASRKNE